MKRTEAVLPVLALAALLIGTLGTVSGATPGYAAYNVQSSFMGASHSVIVNESVSTTSNVNYDKLVLNLISGNSTFSYSRSINSSLDVSPFLPSVSNQSLSYTSGSTSATLSIVKNGSTSVQFNGRSYGLASYALAVTVKSNGTTESTSGAIQTFPSGLIYSVRVSAPIPSLPNLQGLQALGTQGLVSPNYNFSGIGLLGGVSSLQALTIAPSGTVTLTITLISTSLPLSGPSSSTTEQAASIGIGAGAVVSVLALGLGVRYRRNHQPAPQVKPEYSVD